MYRELVLDECADRITDAMCENGKSTELRALLTCTAQYSTAQCGTTLDYECVNTEI